MNQIQLYLTKMSFSEIVLRKKKENARYKDDKTSDMD